MKHSLVILSVAIPLVALANTYAAPAVGDETFTGRVSLSSPSISTTSSGVPAGLKLARLSVSGTVQTQATVTKTEDVNTDAIEGYGGTLEKAQRISNSTILAAILPAGTKTTGYSLRVVLFYDQAPVIQAVKNNATTYTASASVLDLYFGWAEQLDGIFKTSISSVSTTVSPTASGTSINVSGPGKVTGFNPVEGAMFGILFSGVGSFTETSKGYSGSANVAGQDF
jgi:hypothetical protein